MRNLDWNKATKYRDGFLNIKDEAAFLNNDMAANWLKKYDRKKKRRFRKRKRDNCCRKHSSKHKNQLASQTVVVGKDASPCPRCGWLTQIHQHKQVGPKQLRQPYYYSRWYHCINLNCRTKQVMPEEFKVFPSGCSDPSEIARRIEAMNTTLGSHFNVVANSPVRCLFDQFF